MTALESYRKHHSDILKLLRVLDQEILNHKHGTEESEWGKVAEIQKLKFNVAESLCQFSGMSMDQLGEMLQRLPEIK